MQFISKLTFLFNFTDCFLGFLTSAIATGRFEKASNMIQVFDPISIRRSLLIKFMLLIYILLCEAFESG